MHFGVLVYGMTFKIDLLSKLLIVLKIKNEI